MEATLDPLPRRNSNPDPEKEQRRREIKEKQIKERQNRLNNVLREPSIDWTVLRSDFLFGEGLNPNDREPGTLITTLHQAAYAGEADVVRWCLRTGGIVDQRTSVGRTPLHHACDGNQPACLRILLEHRADVNMRTLSLMTPLHLCCQSNSYDSVMTLLHESKQVVDIDGEDTRRRVAQSLTKDKRIHGAIRKYRRSLDEMLKAELLDQALKRLFALFDRNGDGSILPEEWAETLSLIAQRTPNFNDENVDALFKAADENRDGRIDWSEFKADHLQLLEAVGLQFRDLMQVVCDVEGMVFEQTVKLDQTKEEHIESPVLSAPAKAISLKRLAQRIGEGVRAIGSMLAPGTKPSAVQAERAPGSTDNGTFAGSPAAAAALKVLR